MKTLYRTSIVFLMAVILSACGFHKSPAERAVWFFEKGENYIADSLEDNGANKEQLTSVEKTMAQHKPDVTASMEQAMISHKEIMKAIMAGKSGNALIDLENKYHNDSQKTLRSIGKMHQELENIVGEKIWQAAASQREKKFSRR